MKQVVDAYIQIKEKIKIQQKLLNDLKKEEKILMKEIQNYLNENEKPGIRVDENTIITLITNDRKINFGLKAYKEKIRDMLFSKGIEDFVDELLDAKIEHTVQQQRLKISKT